MLFLEGPVLVQLFVPFLVLVFSFVILVMSFFSKIKLFVLGLYFGFLVFCCFVFRLKSSLQKNNLSSSKLVLTQFGYRGFLFLVMLLGCGLW